MHAPKWERFAAVCGVLFVVLAIGGAALTEAGLPGSGASDAEVVAYYEDSNTELKRELGSSLVGFGVFFFLVFLGRLRSALRDAEGGQRTFTAVAFAGGVVLAALLLATAAFEASIASADGFFDSYNVDADTAILIGSLTWWLAGFSLLAGGVMVGASSVIALKSGLLPKWLAIAGLALSAISFFGESAQALIIPLLLVLLWLAVVSVILTKRGTAPSSATP